MKMEYEKDGKWINMEKMDYNHFVSTNVGTGSLKVRMTDIRGKVVKTPFRSCLKAERPMRIQCRAMYSFLNKNTKQRTFPAVFFHFVI